MNDDRAGDAVDLLGECAIYHEKFNLFNITSRKDTCELEVDTRDAFMDDRARLNRKLILEMSLLA